MQVAMGKNLVMAGDAHILMQHGRVLPALGVGVFAVDMAGGALRLNGMGRLFLGESGMALDRDTACLGKSRAVGGQKKRNDDNEV